MINIIRDAKLDPDVDINTAILKDTVLLYTALLDFLRAALKFVDESPALSGIRALVKQSHVQEPKESLEAAASQLSKTVGAASDTLNLRNDQVEQNASMLDKISSLNFREFHNRIRDLHVPGTGQWFLEEETFQSWIRSRKKKASVLWCYGIGTSS